MRGAKKLIESPGPAGEFSRGSKKATMVSKKVYFAVFGSGLGHITRAVDIAGRLGEDFEVGFSSSGQGIAHLMSRSRGVSAVESPSLDVRWERGGFSSRHVLPQFPYTFNAFLRQVAFERRSISGFAPSVVVSDSKLSPVLAAKELSYPVVTMLNQFLVSFPPRFRNSLGKHYERVAGDVLGLLWSLSDSVLMTDLPPPYTIAESNLLSADVSGVVEFVGFTSPRTQVSQEALQKTMRTLEIDGRPLIFCQVSGPDPTKGRFVAGLMRAADELSTDYNVVISRGYSSGGSVPKRLAGGAWVYDWCPVKDELFELADLIVARAGHSTIGQCINRAKPAVLVPIYNHPEQIGNAEKFARLGLGISIKDERFSAGELTWAVSTCLEDTSYKRRAEALSSFSRNYDGVQRTADVIRSFAQ